MHRIQVVCLVLIALMLGALIALVDASAGWDDAGVTAAALLAASGLLGVIHPARAWIWALAVGSWIPVLGIAVNHDYMMVVVLAFPLIGAYTGAFLGSLLRNTNGSAANNDSAEERS